MNLQNTDYKEIGQQPVDQFGQQPVAQIPWGHNILIFSKSSDVKEAMFYVQMTIENSWSRDVLGSNGISINKTLSRRI